MYYVSKNSSKRLKSCKGIPGYLVAAVGLAVHFGDEIHGARRRRPRILRKPEKRYSEEVVVNVVDALYRCPFSRSYTKSRR